MKINKKQKQPGTNKRLSSQRTKDNSLNSHQNSLREVAEKLLAEKSGSSDRLPGTDVKRIIHELRVHQIELEMQNEELRRAQLELEESRSKYVDLYDFAPVGYFTLSAGDLILEANLTGASLLGVERISLFKQRFSRYVANENHGLFYSYTKRLSKTKTRLVCEIKMLKSDGTQFHAQLEGIAVFDDNGNFNHLRMAVLDITERRRAEEAFRESELRYRDLFENVPTGIYRTTPDGRIVMANPTLVRMLGYSSFDKLISRNLEFEGFGANSPRSRFKEMIEREGEVSGLESEWTGRDGAVIHVRESARVIQSKDGTVLYYEGAVEDITERKCVEDALRESLAQLSKKNRYESIIITVTQSVHQSINLQEVLENAVEAMSKNMNGLDNVGIFLVVEQEAVLRAYRGYPEWFIERVKRIPYPKGFTWKTIMEGKPIYCPDADQDTVIGPAGREVGTKSYLSIPINYEGKTIGCVSINSLEKNAFDEDDLKLLEVVVRQIETAVNNARRAEVLQQSEEELRRAKEELELRVEERTQELSQANKELKKEIVERRRAEERIRASLKEKEVLLKEIQHRVKNNLQIIYSLLDLQTEYVTDEQTINMFSETQNRMRSMALIHEQLYQSKDLAKIDFAEYIQNLGDYLFQSYGVRSKGIELEVNVGDVPLSVDTAILCGLIINELVSNSLKHAFPEGKKGTICINLSSDREDFVLIVGDNGVGFPKGLNFRKTESLGLQLVNTLTKQIGGAIRLNRCRGTEFKIVFRE